MHKHHALEDTVYFWFAANTTAGTAGDGASPTFAVRKAGASSSAAPTLTGTPTLLSHASFSDGSHEIAVAATAGNGFVADAEYSVFCSLTISTVNPNGLVGSFRLSPIRANLVQWNSSNVASPDTAGYPKVTIKNGTGTGELDFTSGVVKANWTQYLGTALGGTPALVVAAITKFFNVSTPTGTVNSLPDAVPGATNGLAIVGSQMDLKDAPNATAITAINAAVLTAISNLNNLSALANLYGSPLLEIPDSSSTPFAFTLVVRDNEGKLVDLDASPTIAAANASGTDRSANLSVVSHPSTGRYTFVYTVASNAAEESLRITCSGAVSAEGRYIEWIGAVVNYDTLTQINAIKAKTDLLPSDPAGQSAVEAAITTATSTITTAISAVEADTQDLQARIPAALTGDGLMKSDSLRIGGTLQTAADVGSLVAKFLGMTSLSDWLRRLARGDAGTAGMVTAQTEINTGGTSTYDGTTDNLQDIKDSGGGGGGGSVEVESFSAEALNQLQAQGIRVTSVTRSAQDIDVHIGAAHTEAGMTAWEFTDEAGQFPVGVDWKIEVRDSETTAVGTVELVSGGEGEPALYRAEMVAEQTALLDATKKDGKFYVLQQLEADGDWILRWNGKARFIAAQRQE